MSCNSGFVDDVVFSHKVCGVGNIGVGVVLKQSKFPIYSPEYATLFDFVIVCGSKQRTGSEVLSTIALFIHFTVRCSA